MALVEALEVLGVAPGMPMDEVRVVYRRLVRASHPDVARSRDDATERTAQLTAAFAAVRAAVRADGRGVVPEPPAPPPPPGPPRRRPWEVDRVDADVVEGDTIAIAAPPPEAFALLLEASAAVGTIGYVDRRLGILEIMVRFEGGPTCSVLITLQGRAFVTEAFCTMESIEAAPTPPVRPVVEALVDALRNPPADG
jgi:hypothetical protein